MRALSLRSSAARGISSVAASHAACASLTAARPARCGQPRPQRQAAPAQPARHGRCCCAGATCPAAAIRGRASRRPTARKGSAAATAQTSPPVRRERVPRGRRGSSRGLLPAAAVARQHELDQGQHAGCGVGQVGEHGGHRRELHRALGALQAGLDLHLDRGGRGLRLKLGCHRALAQAGRLAEALIQHAGPSKAVDPGQRLCGLAVELERSPLRCRHVQEALQVERAAAPQAFLRAEESSASRRRRSSSPQRSAAVRPSRAARCRCPDQTAACSRPIRPTNEITSRGPKPRGYGAAHLEADLVAGEVLVVVEFHHALTCELFPSRLLSQLRQEALGQPAPVKAWCEAQTAKDRWSLQRRATPHEPKSCSTAPAQTNASRGRKSRLDSRGWRARLTSAWSPAIRPPLGTC